MREVDIGSKPAPRQARTFQDWGLAHGKATNVRRGWVTMTHRWVSWYCTPPQTSKPRDRDETATSKVEGLLDASSLLVPNIIMGIGGIYSSGLVF